MAKTKRLDETVALTNTRDLLDALAGVGVTAWVQDGTLLGLIRDGGIISWDHDTDTGMYAEDWSQRAHDALVQAGFSLAKMLGVRNDGWQHRWTRDGVKTDIFFYYPDGDGRVWHAAYVGGRTQYRFHYDPFPVKAIETPVGKMLAPDPPVKFLLTKYGSDWRTPKKRWHFATSPRNASKA